MAFYLPQALSWRAYQNRSRHEPAYSKLHFITLVRSFFLIPRSSTNLARVGIELSLVTFLVFSSAKSNGFEVKICHPYCNSFLVFAAACEKVVSKSEFLV